MGNSASASAKISSQDKALLSLKNQRDTLHRHRKKLHHNIATLTTSAQTALLTTPTQKPVALSCLRRRKYLLTLLERTDAQLETIERLTGDIESAVLQKGFLEKVEEGTRVLKGLNEKIGGVEGVERVMGEAGEEIGVQKEVSEALGGGMSVQDEEEVEDELEALEREVEGRRKVVLPDVPEHQVPVVKEEIRTKKEAKKEEEVEEGRQAILA